MKRNKLLDDLADLTWPNRGIASFHMPLTIGQWCELEEWCNSTFGAKNWFIEKNKIHTKHAEHLTLFLLRWT